MGPVSVLVIDDDFAVRAMLADFLGTLGFSARAAATAAEGRLSAAENAPDVALVDVRLPDANGLTLLDELHTDNPELGIIMLTGQSDASTARKALHQGATDVLVKPIDLESLEIAVLRASELVRLRREVAMHRTRRGVAFIAPGVERLIDIAARNSDVPVLIIGEPGTGKGAVARAIHDRSDRALLPFLEVDCGFPAIRPLEGALFGQERRTDDSSAAAMRGVFEMAGSGTVFLEAIGACSFDVQAGLLRVVEDRRFMRLHGSAELESSARLLAATDTSLGDLVAAESFRIDLYYRLQLLTITVPSLRERTPELASLCRAMLPLDCEVSAGALRAMERYTWPGNVRELRNVLWRAHLLCGGGPIEVRHLGLPRTVSGETDAPKSLAEVERKAIADALRATDGNKVRAAALLGIARSTLQEKLKLSREDG